MNARFPRIREISITLIDLRGTKAGVVGRDRVGQHDTTHEAYPHLERIFLIDRKYQPVDVCSKDIGFVNPQTDVSRKRSARKAPA